MNKTFWKWTFIWLGAVFSVTLAVWWVEADSWYSWPIVFIVPLVGYVMPFGGLMTALLMVEFGGEE